MKFLVAQLDLKVGDIENNYYKIQTILKKKKNFDIAIFPELALMGYPPFDLLFKKKFIKDEAYYLKKLTNEFPKIPIIIGSVNMMDLPRSNSFDISSISDFSYRLQNVGKFLFNGKVIGQQAKFNLPVYDVYNEKRYFDPGKNVKIYAILKKNKKIDKILEFILKNEMFFDENKNKFKKNDIIKFYEQKEYKVEFLGISVCEDIWVKGSVPYIQGRYGCDHLVNISASPFYIGKKDIRQKVLKLLSKGTNTNVIYVNHIGGQDSLIFDGQSMLFSNGILKECIEDFEEKTSVFNTNTRKTFLPIKKNIFENIYMVLLTGLRDYFRKNGFKKAIIGISGGIDSALVATLASAALGTKNVTGILMPSKYSSQHSIKDGLKLCENLGISHRIIPINLIFDSYLKSLKGNLNIKKGSITEQNLQARIRGNILMAYANNTNGMVLSTGNKSELAVGYSTLYGDLAGGLAVISDLYKTTVFKLCKYINKIYGWNIIPKNILTKPPSAELAPDQKDEDDLPPYDILDKILKLNIEKQLTTYEIYKLTKINKNIIRDIIKRVDRNEYKRQQAPIGFKISPKSFGYGRIMPITNGYYGK